MSSLWLWTLTASCLFGHSLSQSNPSPTPYDTLPPPPTYTEGKFSVPDTSTTQIFTEGSQITVAWTTTFSALNLYYIAGQDYNDPVTVAIGLRDTSINFKLTCVNNNCSVPYSFRAVDAGGSVADQKGGGFYTGQFWLRPASTSTSASATSTQSSSSTSTQSSTSTSTTAPSTTSSPVSAATTSTASSPTATPRPSTNGTAIGAGVGAGVGVALLLLGAFFFWRHHNRKNKAKNSQASFISTDGTWSPRPMESKVPDYYPHSTSEVPAWQSDPQELPGRHA